MDRQKIITTMLIACEVGILCIVLVAGILMKASSNEKLTSSEKESEQFPMEEVTEDTQSTEEDVTEENNEEVRQIFSDEVEQKLGSMTIEQKVAQLFVVSPEAITGVDRVTISGNGTRDALQKYPVAGLIYAQTNFVGAEQAEAMINGAQNFSKSSSGVALFILIKEDAPAYASYATASFVPQGNGALINGIQTCTATNSTEVVTAIQSGMNMIYAPTNFTEIYGAVVAAVNDGTISQVRLENAVGSVLSKKMQ